MALVASLRFVPGQEDIDGNGWEVHMGQDDEAPTVSTYATITAAQAAILAAYQADPDVDGYFQQAAEAEVLTTEAANVAAAKAALLAAEGL